MSDECTICLDHYNGTDKKPHMTPCGHTFCGGCLRRNQSEGSGCCPNCRMPVDLSKVPVNYILLDMLEQIGLLRTEQADRRAMNEAIAALARREHVNLYVKNLEPTVTDTGLMAMFAQYGTITSAKVMVDSNQLSRGFGFVCFERMEDAASAVKALHNFKPTNTSKSLYVSVHQKKEDRQQQLATLHGAAPAAPAAAAAPLPAAPAPAVRGRGGAAPNRGGRGGVAAAAAPAATPAAAAPAGRGGRGGATRGGRGGVHATPARDESVNLYVSNMDPVIDEARLHALFSPFGSIVQGQVKVMRDANQRSLGYGFVRFERPIEAIAAMQALHNKMEGTKVLNVAVHQKKDKPAPAQVVPTPAAPTADAALAAAYVAGLNAARGSVPPITGGYNGRSRGAPGRGRGATRGAAY